MVITPETTRAELVEAIHSLRKTRDTCKIESMRQRYDDQINHLLDAWSEASE